MHCTLPKYTDKIIDWDVTGVPVNGAIMCESFAWQKAQPDDKPKAINPNVATNADNYGWYMNARWFDVHWDMTKKFTPQPLRRHDELIVVGRNTTANMTASAGGAPSARLNDTDPFQDLDNGTLYVHRSARRAPRTCLWCSEKEVDNVD